MDENNLLHSPFQPVVDDKVHTNLISLLLEKSKEHAENGKTRWMTDALTGESFNFADYDNLTRRIGSALYKRGLRKDDIVIFMEIDIVKQPIFLGGIWRANGIGRASYPEDDEETLLERVRESRTGWIYCEPMHAPMCLRVADKIYWDVEVIVTSKEPVEGCTTIYELMEDDGSELPELAASPDDAALIMCTSGTTGNSKGAVITQKAFIWQVYSMASGVPLFEEEDKVNLAFTKSTHISGATTPFATLVAGISCTYLTFISRQRVLDAVEKYKPSFVFGFPTFLLLLVHDPEASKLDLTNLEIIASGGAPVTPAVISALMTLPSMKSVINLYGLTECVPLITSLDFDRRERLDDRPESSVGQLAPGVTAKFMDVETGELVGQRSIGEFCAKCDGLFKEYYLNPEASKKAFDEEGYFKTGDVGYCDENGFIFLVDRAKEIFKYFNNHISPTEIENIILQHPSVAEVCVVGIPDPDGGGQIPRAFCVPTKTCATTPAELLEYTNSKLAGYKHLRGGLYFIPELPKGKTGKVTRQLVEKLPVPAEDLEAL